MTHFLSRLEKTFNENGSIKEIFLSVKLRISETETWEYGYWMNPAELDLMTLDEQAVDAIVEKVAVLALAAYEALPEE